MRRDLPGLPFLIPFSARKGSELPRCRRLPMPVNIERFTHYVAKFQELNDLGNFNICLRDISNP
jgi:hypothetical protein